jgi:hypothetical protein
MDCQDLSGIRGLWGDRRDSSQWFTFWAVVILGSLSMVVTSLGLIVSIVQTVGTFKGLELYFQRFLYLLYPDGGCQEPRQSPIVDVR